MINVSQAWKDNQAKQSQAKSNIRLSIYSKGDTSATLKEVLTKEQIVSFSYDEDGSVINDKLPNVEIGFEVVKNGVLEYEFKKTDLVKIEYGYFLNGAWEWIEKGVYEISDIIIKQNNMTAKYVLKYINQGIWGKKDYSGSAFIELGVSTINNWSTLTYKSYIGRIKTTFENDEHKGEFEFDCGDYDSEIFTKDTLDFYNIPSIRCPVCLLIEKAQFLAQDFGASFVIKGAIDNNSYKTKLCLENLDNNKITKMLNDCIVINKINQKLYPEIIEEKRIKNLIIKTYKQEYHIPLPLYMINQNVSKQTIHINNAGTFTTQFENGFIVNAEASADYSTGLSYGQQVFFNVLRECDIVLWIANDETKSETTLIDSNGNEDYVIKLSNKRFATHWLKQPYTYEYALRIDPSIELYDLVYDEYENMYFICIGIDFRYNGGAFDGKLILKKIEFTKTLNAPVYVSCSNNRLQIRNDNNKSLNTRFLIGEKKIDYFNGMILIPFNISANSTSNYEINGNLLQAFQDYTNQQLKDNVYAYFEDGFGNISNLTLMWEANYIAQPIIQNLSSQGSDFTFDVVNDNDFEVKLTIDYDNGRVYEFNIPANSSLTINNDNANELGALFDDGEWGRLAYDIFCYFTNLDETLTSANTTILEANLVLQIEIDNMTYNANSFSFTMYNPNDFRVLVCIYDSEGENSLYLNAHETFTANNNTMSYLSNDFVNKYNGQLSYSVVCNAENEDTGGVSYDTTILEAD